MRSYTTRWDTIGGAVARKLAVLMHHLWSTGEVYAPLYSTEKNEEATKVA